MGIFSSRNKMNQDPKVLMESLLNNRQNNPNNNQIRSNAAPLTRDDFKFYMDALLGCLTQKGNLGVQSQDDKNLLNILGPGRLGNLRPPGQDTAGPNLNQSIQNLDIHRLNALKNRQNISPCIYFSPHSYNSFYLRTPLAGLWSQPFSCEAPTNYPLSNYLLHQPQNHQNQTISTKQMPPVNIKEEQKENNQIIAIRKNAEPFEIEITTTFTHKIRSRPN